mmetsp:Transcript_19055/g.29233  ORF Transcript_19055/g.29233 Transcript_19055/m.29233 type:complete len:148 (-) Transcript_19055:3406-3849(-)
MSEWFDMASKFWTFTGTFIGFISYNNLEEKKQDKALSKFANELYQEMFIKQEGKIIEDLDKLFIKILQEAYPLTFENVATDMRKKIEEYFSDLLNEGERRFETYCKDNDVLPDLKNRRGILIMKANESMEIQTKTYYNMKISKELES